MRHLRVFWSRLLNIVDAGRRDRELDEELSSHLAMEIEANVRRGMNGVDAGREARRRLGNPLPAAEAIRDRRGLPIIETSLRDAGYALRSLRRAPGFAISTILVLALGIGASIAVATLLHAIVWLPLPVSEPHRIVKLAISFDGEFDRKVSGHVTWFSYPEFLNYQQTTHALEALAALRTEDVALQHGGEVAAVRVAVVSSNYFTTLGVGAAAGRVLADGDARQASVVLSHRAWRLRFDANPGVIGQSILIERKPYHVVGVADRRFTGTNLESPDVWVCVEAFATASGHPEWLAEDNRSWIELVGRLPSHGSVEAANREARDIAARFDRTTPLRRTSIRVARASRMSPGLVVSPSDRARAAVVASAGTLATFLILLICASNAAGLLLARGIARQREIAVRVALGAAPARIVRQLLTESALLAFAAAAVGLMTSTWALRSAARFLPMAELMEHVSPGPAIIAFAVLTACATTLLCGLAPARTATRIDTLPALRTEGAGMSQSAAATRLRNSLLTAQVAVSTILLVAAALLTRGILQASTVETGVRIHDTYVVRTDLLRHGYDRARALAFAAELHDRLRAVPDVAGVGYTSVLPLAGRGLAFAGRDDQSLRQTQCNQADSEYFGVLGIPVVAGRLFTSRDDWAATVVNEAFARWLWPDESLPLGRRFAFRADARVETLEVVGIVRTVQSVAIGVLDGPTVYRPIERNAHATATLLVRTRGARLEQQIAGVIKEIDPALPPNVSALADRVDQQTAPASIAAAAAGIVGLLALLIAAVGIHGVVEYTVVRKTREIGVHLARARTRDVIAMVLVSSLRPVAVGVGVGIAVAVLSARLMSSLLFGVSALDPVAYVGAAGVLLVVTVAAGYVPANRALAIGPMAALRHE